MGLKNLSKNKQFSPPQYPSLFKTLGLPVHHKAFGAVMVGYPKLRYQRLPLRNAPRVSYL